MGPPVLLLAFGEVRGRRRRRREATEAESARVLAGPDVSDGGLAYALAERVGRPLRVGDEIRCYIGEEEMTLTAEAIARRLDEERPLERLLREVSTWPAAHSEASTLSENAPNANTVIDGECSAPEQLD